VTDAPETGAPATGRSPASPEDPAQPADPAVESTSAGEAAIGDDGVVDEGTSTAAVRLRPARRGSATVGLPARSEPVPAGDRPSLEIARRAAELAEDKKAGDIVVLDLSPLTTLADYFVICSGGSERQLDAVADGIIEGLRAEGVRPIGREGAAASHWILVDFGSVIVHIFAPPEREYYQLERHWAEARTVLRIQ
jgi:ribosome-associated protein